MMKTFKTTDAEGDIQIWHLDEFHGQRVMVAHETDTHCQIWIRMGSRGLECQLPDDPMGSTWEPLDGYLPGDTEPITQAWTHLVGDTEVKILTVDQDGDQRYWSRDGDQIRSEAQGPFGTTVVRQRDDGTLEWSAPMVWRPCRTDDPENIQDVFRRLMND